MSVAAVGLGGFSADRYGVLTGLLSLAAFDKCVDRHDRNVTIFRQVQQLLAASHVQSILTADLAQHGGRP